MVHAYTYMYIVHELSCIVVIHYTCTFSRFTVQSEGIVAPYTLHHWFYFDVGLGVEPMALMWTHWLHIQWTLTHERLFNGAIF